MPTYDTVRCCNTSKQHRYELLTLYENDIPDLSGYSWVTNLTLDCLNSSVKWEFIPQNITFLEIKNANEEVLDFDKVPKSVEIFKFIDCKTTTLKSAHPNIKKLILHSNNIKKFDGKDFTNVYCLNLNSNKLKEIISFPPNCTEIGIQDNPLVKCPPISSKVSDLWCSRVKLDKLPIFEEGSTLTDFEFSSNKLLVLDGLPDSVRVLICNKSHIGKIQQLPKSLRKLCLIDNMIKEIDISSLNHLKELNLTNNLLDKMPKGLMECKSLEKINVSDNHIEYIIDLPNSVKELDCTKNKIKTIRHDLEFRVFLDIKKDQCYNYGYDTVSSSHHFNNSNNSNNFNTFNYFSNNTNNDTYRIVLTKHKVV